MVDREPVRWYCEDCDEEFPDGMRACPRCGRALERVEAPVHVPTAIRTLFLLGLLTLTTYAVIMGIVMWATSR